MPVKNFFVTYSEQIEYDTLLLTRKKRGHACVHMPSPYRVCPKKARKAAVSLFALLTGDGAHEINDAATDGRILDPRKEAVELKALG